MRTSHRLVHLSFSFLVSLSAFAHHPGEDYGRAQGIDESHYHLHFPVMLDLEGNLMVHAPFINHPDTDMGEHTGHGDETTAHTGHMDGLMIGLMLGGDFDRLTRHLAKDRVVLQAGQTQVPLARDYFGFTRLESLRWSLMAGPMAEMSGASLGLMPSRSAQVTRITSVATAADERLELHRPNQSSWVDALQPGDQIAYQKNTGLMASLNLGFLDLAHAGLTGMFHARWRIAIEKKAQNVVRTTVSADKMLGFGPELQPFLFTSIGLQWMKHHGARFAFSLDTSRKEGRLALDAILKGRLDVAQELAGDGNGVRFWMDSDDRMGGRVADAHAGIPVLIGLQASHARMWSRSVMNLHGPDAHEHHSHLALIQTERASTGLLSDHFVTGEYVIGTVDWMEGEVSGMGSTLLWTIEEDNMRPERVSRFLDRVGHATGLSKKLAIELPRLAPGYMRAEVRVIFSMGSLEHLMALSRNGDLRSQFTAKAQELFGPEAGLELSKRSLRRIEKQLSDAVQAHDAEGWRKLAGQFAKLHALLLSDDRVFAVVRGLVPGIQAELRMEGERIPHVTKRISWE